MEGYAGPLEIRRQGRQKRGNETDYHNKSHHEWELLEKEGNLLYLNDPISVVGDIHGQFYDLLKILSIGGNPETTKV